MTICIIPEFHPKVRRTCLFCYDMLCCKTSNILVDVKVKIAVGNEKFGDGSYQKKGHNGNSNVHSFRNRFYGNDQRKINGTMWF